jgi:hypothetical protein
LDSVDGTISTQSFINPNKQEYYNNQLVLFFKTTHKEGGRFVEDGVIEGKGSLRYIKHLLNF